MPTYYYTCRYDLRQAVKDNESLGSRSNLSSQRQALGEEIDSWRKTQFRAIPELETLYSTIDPSTHPEEENLFLPSDIPIDQHVRLGIGSLAAIEYQLREGQANDAVQSLCNTILHGMVLRDAKNAHARGVYQNTRALKYINAVKAKKRTWMSRYRESRSKVLFLSQHALKTLEAFPELREEDTYAKNAASAREVGDGARTDSWIWTFGRLKGLSKSEQDEFALESESKFFSCHQHLIYMSY
jgi:hypothetical protein